MLIKTAVCEEAILCKQCSRYHAPNVDCTKVFTASDEPSVNGDMGESINRNSSDVTSFGAKGVSNEE